jgi:fructosamine-3-kinase
MVPDHDASRAVLQEELHALGRADGVTGLRSLAGGSIASTWLISYADGTRLVGKTLAGATPGLFRAEADGLAALRGTGHLATPAVLAVTSRSLLLEALAEVGDTDQAWEAFARDLADAHRGTVSDRFGWAEDGWLGRLRQVNTWTASGHDFFAENRLLRYLSEPALEEALTAADRRAVERLCARLPEIIPAMPAVLTHGDLWTGNLVAEPDGRIAVIDPAVSLTWAEVDLSMLWSNPRPPASDQFFRVYQELNPSPDGWRDRMPVLHLREHLSVLAHFGPAASGTIAKVREILTPFQRPRGCTAR